MIGADDSRADQAEATGLLDAYSAPQVGGTVAQTVGYPEQVAA
jgi:hypothetical protein